MKIAIRFAAAVAASLVFAGATTAQKDRIVLHDGTVIDKVTVTGFDLRKVEFKQRGSTDTRPSDQVAMLDVAKVKDEYRRAYSSIRTQEGPGNFLQRADKLTDGFLKQFGYVEAAKLFMGNEQYSEAFQVLEKLAGELPDSGFAPEVYRQKCRYYASRARSSDLESVATKYENAALTQGFPKGCAIEAKFYRELAKGFAKGADPKKLRAAMQGVMSEAAGHANIRQMAKLQVANTMRQEGNYTEAESEYREILELDHVSTDVLAGAWLGMGHVHYNEGTPAKKEPYLDALKAFLHVWTDAQDGPPAVVAEALHFGSESASKWGGKDASFMSRRLAALLRREFPENPWR